MCLFTSAPQKCSMSSHGNMYRPYSQVHFYFIGKGCRVNVYSYAVCTNQMQKEHFSWIIQTTLLRLRIFTTFSQISAVSPTRFHQLLW